MDIGGEGVSVYAEAKGMLTKQLCQNLVPALQQYFLDLLEDAKQKETDPKKVLVKFQTLLEEISDWNLDKVQRETTALIMSTHCDYLEDLLTAVFIAHTKVLSAIRLTSKQKKLQITIPKLDHFLHRTMTECARILWSNVFRFSPNAPSVERQKNILEIEKLLYDGVHQGIQGMLPVKNILREYLKDDPEDDDDEEEEDAEEGGGGAASEVSEAPPPPTPSTTPEPPAGGGLAAEGKETVVDVSGQQVIHLESVPAAINPLTSPSTPLPAFSGLDSATTPPPAPEVVEEEPPEGDEFEGLHEEITLIEGAPIPMDEFEDLEAPAKAAAAPRAPAAPAESDVLPMEFEEL